MACLERGGAVYSYAYGGVSLTWSAGQVSRGVTYLAPGQAQGSRFNLHDFHHIVGRRLAVWYRCRGLGDSRVVWTRGRVRRNPAWVGVRQGVTSFVGSCDTKIPSCLSVIFRLSQYPHSVSTVMSVMSNCGRVEPRCGPLNHWLLGRSGQTSFPLSDPLILCIDALP